MLLDRFSLLLATRYSRPRLGQGASGLLSAISLLGIGLAVFSMVVVTSVMNGFERELQNRMLTLVPHLQFELVYNEKNTLQPNSLTANSPPLNTQQQTEPLQYLVQQLQAQPGIKAVAPFIADVAIIHQGSRVLAADLMTIEPVSTSSSGDISQHLVEGELEALQTNPFGVIIGSGLARQLGVSLDDTIDITVPKVYISPLGPTTRQKRFRVVGIFQVGSELDVSLLMIDRGDAKKLLGRKHQADGLRLVLENPYDSANIAEAVLTNPQFNTREQAVALGGSWSDWRQSNAELFSAVAMEKTMMFVLLLAVVAVACFNVISIVLMTAHDKRSDIAVLRTIGASKASIRNVFVLQGVIIGTLGSVAGAALGVTVAPQIGKIVSTLESALGMTVFDPTVYYIPYLPSLLNWADVALVTVAAIGISVSVAVLPALRAAQIDPVLSLKQST